jgi:hypothetical protein
MTSTIQTTREYSPLLNCVRYIITSNQFDGLRHDRTHIMLNRELILFGTQNMITGGLGFLDTQPAIKARQYKNSRKGPLRYIEDSIEGQINHETDSDKGLQLHLRDMEDRTNFRFTYANLLMNNHAQQAIAHVEDVAESAFQIYEQLIRKLEISHNQMAKELGLEEIPIKTTEQVFEAIKRVITLV